MKTDFIYYVNLIFRGKSDPLRENPNDRINLFEIYKMELENLGHKYYIVEGKDRLENVIEKNLSTE